MEERMEAILRWVASTEDLSNKDTRADMVVRLVMYFGASNVLRVYRPESDTQDLRTDVAFSIARSIIDEKLEEYIY